MLDARQKSLEVLGLSENSSDTEIKKRYQELYEDYNIRLTNAPTPALKKLYQKNLQEIEDAYSAFKLDDNPKEKTHETTLPSSRPSAAANTNESIHTRNQPEVRAGKNFNGPQANNEALNQKKNTLARWNKCKYFYRCNSGTIGTRNVRNNALFPRQKRNRGHGKRTGGKC